MTTFLEGYVKSKAGINVLVMEWPINWQFVLRLVYPLTNIWWHLEICINNKVFVDKWNYSIWACVGIQFIDMSNDKWSP